MEQRKVDIVRFYSLIEGIEARLGGRVTLAQCGGKSGFPTRGVYFFMEPKERRSDSGVGLRVVRVGTHGLNLDSKATLWNRLSHHRGSVASGGGTHRGSIFRALVGATLPGSTAEGSRWGQDKSAGAEIRRFEISLEREVSRIIKEMPFVWLGVDDTAHPDSARGAIERGTIALLSNYRKPAIDPPSPSWRGLLSDRERVRMSGLWNNRHVDETYDPGFLDEMQSFVERM